MKVELKNVKVSYGDFSAIKNFSATFEIGKIYGLIGRNSAGKTSILSVLANFRDKASGEVLVNGENLFENIKYAQDVNFIYQRNFAEEGTKVLKYIKNSTLFRPNFNMNYAIELLERFEVSPKVKMRKLSKGQQSAVSAVIGLASNSSITIYDEAYIGMDAPARELFYKEVLKNQEKSPKIVIMSTHLISEVEHLFNEVIMLHKGNIISKGSYEEVISEGVSVTGAILEIDKFIKGKKVISEKTLGNLKQVVLNEKIDDNEISENLEIGRISLNDLFIQKTGGER